MDEKVALKGFTGARMWPITANNATTYATDTMVALPHAQNLTKDDQGQEYYIPADDAAYDSGTEYDYTDMEFTVAQLTLDLQAKLTGATYDATEKTYLFKNLSQAPEFAYGYAALMKNGQYRMWKHYVCKLMSVKVDHATKGQNKGEIQPYRLRIRAMGRVADGAVEFIKDSTDGTYDWLNTIDQLPVSGGGGGEG